MLIDTHCHLDFEDFDKDRDAVINRFKEAGVEFVINVASSLDGSRRSIELANRYEFIFAAVGIHPHHAQETDDQSFEKLKGLLSEKKVVAIGEVGLDYYRNLSSPESQKRLFEKSILLAKERGLPIVFHARDAHKDVLAIIKSVLGRPIKGVMHCFSGDEIFLKECLELGLYVSFTCNLTFKNADKLRQIARLVPMERLLIETDSPFLAPEQFRGKRNEPSYMKYLVSQISQLKNTTDEKVAQITTKNAMELFRLDGAA